MEAITDEVLLLIFAFLDTDDIIQSSFVSKRFYRVANDGQLNRSIALKKNLHISSTFFHRKVHTSSDRLQLLILQDCFWIPSYQIVAALQKCTKLTELILIGSHLSMTGLVKIASNNPRLKRLGWSIPNTNFSPELQKDEKNAVTLSQIQTIFKKLNGILLRFDSLSSFEQFLPIFDRKDFLVDEFGLEYLSDRSSSYFTIGNGYKMYVKCKEKFQICLSDAIDANRFLHFNMLVMDFVVQTITKAAQKHDIVVLHAPGNLNSPCWKYVTQVLNSVSCKSIDMSYCLLAKEQMTWLSKLKNLTFLNLSDVENFKGNLMRVIASNCCELQSLNLQHCDDWIDKDLHGLEAIADNCTKLKDLNLSCLHIHASHSHVNKLCSIISKIKSMRSLSISPCCLVNNIDLITDTKLPFLQQLSSSSPRWTFTSYKPQIQSNLVLSDESSKNSASSESVDFSRKLRSSQEEENTILAGCGLDTIISSCCNIEELEIIVTGFHSPFSKLSNKQDQFLCPTASHLKDKNFLCISNLSNLKQLTLAGLSSVGNFSSLCNITQNCKNLEVLSIAHCGLGGHSGSLLSLKQALTFCKKLKKFRLDQPHYIMKEPFFEALATCKELEIICIISKSGKTPKNSEDYIRLLEQCPRLVSFFLFSGSMVSEAKKIQSILTRRFGKLRPSLRVGILPYFNALTEEGLRQVPYVYIRDVIRFESRVATSNYFS